MIPGLQNAEFSRYGVMHRNTYIESPKLLSSEYRMKDDPKVFFAGQITGVEGYIESTASGYLAGYYAALSALKKDSPVIFSAETMIGAMAAYISDCNVKHFAPMNANFGLVAPRGYKVKGKKKEKNMAYAERALAEVRINNEKMEMLRK